MQEYKKNEDLTSLHFFDEKISSLFFLYDYVGHIAACMVAYNGLYILLDDVFCSQERYSYWNCQEKRTRETEAWKASRDKPSKPVSSPKP